MKLRTKRTILSGLTAMLVPASLLAVKPLQGSGGLGNTAPPRLQKGPRYEVERSHELDELMEDVSESTKKLNAALEEWGTLGLSGLVLAAPGATFGVNINAVNREKDDKKKYNFEYWFGEASKAEGTAQASERIFNSLVASGTLKLAPEQAAIADALFARQRNEKQLFEDQLQRSQIQRGVDLQNFQQTRTDSVLARQVRIDTAQATADRARTARAEAELVRNTVAQRKEAVDGELRQLQGELDALPATNPDRTTKEASYKEKLVQADKVNSDLSTAENALAARVADEKTAQDGLAAAMAANVSTGTLAGSTVNPVSSSPTFGQTDFAAATEITPGSSIKAASAFVAAVPQFDPKKPASQPATLDKLNNVVLPKLLGKPAADNNPTDAAFPARARLIDAASNQLISRIFDFLGDPSAAAKFTDKPILMAAGTIAVNPGWRSAQDYDGQIDVSARYVWTPARRMTCQEMARAVVPFNADELKVAAIFAKTGIWPEHQEEYRYTARKAVLEQDTNAPLAAAVSPLMERQNIDQASSKARQDEIALFLSASLARSGMKAAGDVFDKYVRMRRLDVATRSSLPVINSYGLGGSRFGFNVTSRLQAVGDVKKAKPASILEKQNFPILVVFGLSTDDLAPRLVHNASTGQAQIWEPHIVLNQTHRWGRQRKRGAFHQVLHSIFLPGFPGRPQEQPSESYELLDRVNLAREKLGKFVSENPLAGKQPMVSIFQAVNNADYDLLREAYYGAETELELPVEYLVKKSDPPIEQPKAVRTAISDVFPRQLKVRDSLEGPNLKEAEVVLVGTNLDKVNRKGIFTASDKSIVKVTVLPMPPGIPAGQAVALKFVWNPPNKNPLQFQLALPVGDPVGDFQEKLFSPMLTILP